MEKFTFFWDGVFSNWYQASFKIDSYFETFNTIHMYNCSEQFMMAEKARLFSDKDSLLLIMEADHPREQKKLGRQIKYFDADKWSLVSRDVVYKGCKAKFDQNPELKEELIKTKGTTLVEASPYDKIWGIGLGAKDPRAQSRDIWLGTNWLGEVLTKLRHDYIGE